MKHTLVLLLFSALSLFAEVPWPAVEYAEARAYYYNERGHDGAALVENGKIHPKVVNQGGTLMPPAQVKALLDILNNRRKESMRPGCYWPRHGVIFFDRNKKIVAFYEVCFECNLQRSEPEGIAPLTYLPAIADIFEQLKLPLGPDGKTAKDVRKEWEKLYLPEPPNPKAK